jgi:hypothetical protein
MRVNLLDLMTPGREDMSLDRLEVILGQYEAHSDAEQDAALERAVAFCEREWGGYLAGLEALARRVEVRAGGSVDGAMQSLRLREEGGEPGAIIRSLRARRERERVRVDERASVIAHYGSEAAATAPTAFERVFITAAASLAEPGQDAAEPDPFAVLDGWHLAWHEVPAGLQRAVAAAHPLPDSVAAARDECLHWEERLRHVEILFDCPGEGSLPTACAARRKVVEELWRRRLPARSLGDVQARLEYWAGRGGDDGAGYGVLLGDLATLTAAAAASPSAESTKDRARRLKRDHPDWSLARIGDKLGISRQAVHKHLKGASARKPAAAISRDDHAD